MGLWDWLFGSDVEATSHALSPVHIARGRGFTFEIVGEASYQEALDTLCGGKCEDGHRLLCTAQLCFQEDNPHDPNAIAVLIGGKVVGYVPRDIAPAMRSAILRLNSDERPVTCDAQIVGGWMRDEEDVGHYGVKLNLSDPLRAAPGPKSA